MPVPVCLVTTQIGLRAILKGFRVELNFVIKAGIPGTLPVWDYQFKSKFVAKKLARASPQMKYQFMEIHGKGKNLNFR